MYRRTNCFAWAVVVGSLCIARVAAEPSPPTLIASAAPEVRAAIQEAASGQSIAGERIDATAVRVIYGTFGDQPLWQLDRESDTRRGELETALSTVSQHGIRPDDLHLEALARLAHPTTARALAERDVLLTDALLRYVGELRRGAVDAASLGPDWHIAPDPFDAAKSIVGALRSERFTEFLQSLPPPDPQYGALLDGLQRYRTISHRGGWAAIPGRDELKLAAHDTRLNLLRDRLAAEGYLPTDGRTLDVGNISLAVRAFQARQGLDADGRIGQKTLAALNVSAAGRVDQIAANLERWRHLPRQFGSRYIAVNLADASLDLIENGASVFHTRVIIGDVRHQSPIFRATVTGVTFNPPWNVPPSIAIREMLPRLKRNPGYLAANDIVIVGRVDDPFGLRVNWRQISGGKFPFRLQQRPGTKNSLGTLKLEMPNPWDVYLHDTPAKALFARNQRGFSHGCIRVQQPGELVRRLLANEAWDADAIARELASGATHTVPLHQPVPVYLLYWTAFAAADGNLNFRDDLYGRDAPVERALGLDRAPQNATELQRTASCDQPIAESALRLN